MKNVLVGLIIVIVIAAFIVHRHVTP